MGIIMNSFYFSGFFHGNICSQKMKRKLFLCVVCLAALYHLVQAEDVPQDFAKENSVEDSSKHKTVNPVPISDVSNQGQDTQESDIQLNVDKTGTGVKDVLPEDVDLSSESEEPSLETSKNKVSDEGQLSSDKMSSEQQVSSDEEPNNEQILLPDTRQTQSDVEAETVAQEPESKFSVDNVFPDPINFDSLDTTTIEQVSKVRVNKNTLHTTIRFTPDKNGHVRTLKYVQTKMQGGDVIFEKEESWETNRLVRERDARSSVHNDITDNIQFEAGSENRDNTVVMGLIPDEEEEEYLAVEQKRGKHMYVCMGTHTH